MSVPRYDTVPFAYFSFGQAMINRGLHKVNSSHQGLPSEPGLFYPSPGKLLPEVAESCNKKQQGYSNFKYLPVWSVCLLFEPSAYYVRLHFHRQWSKYNSLPLQKEEVSLLSFLFLPIPPFPSFFLCCLPPPHHPTAESQRVLPSPLSCLSLSLSTLKSFTVSVYLINLAENYPFFQCYMSSVLMSYMGTQIQ